MKRKQVRQRERRKDKPERPQPERLIGELMTPEEVARFFSVKVKRVRNWERRRTLTPIQTPRGERRYLRMEVEHLAAMYAQR